MNRVWTEDWSQLAWPQHTRIVHIHAHVNTHIVGFMRCTWDADESRSWLMSMCAVKSDACHNCLMSKDIGWSDEHLSNLKYSVCWKWEVKKFNVTIAKLIQHGDKRQWLVCLLSLYVISSRVSWNKSFLAVTSSSVDRSVNRSANKSFRVLWRPQFSPWDAEIWHVQI